MKKNILILLTTILLSILITFATFAQSNYYISNYGSDLNDGKTLSSSKATLTSVVNSYKLKYDTIFIYPGNYSDKNITVDSTDNNFIIKGIGKVIFDSDSTNQLITADSSYNITIENLTIQNYLDPIGNGGGALYFNDCKNIKINKCIFTNNCSIYGSAIECDGTNNFITINNSLFYKNKCLASDKGYDFGTIGIDYGASGTIINCTLIDNNDGIYFSNSNNDNLDLDTIKVYNTVSYRNASNIDFGKIGRKVNLYNCAYTNYSTAYANNKIDNVLTNDDDFVSVSNKDYHLSKYSNLINLGTNTNYSFDLDNNLRDGISDIGCYEYLSTESINEISYTKPTENLLHTTNILGQIVNSDSKGLLFNIYSDGKIIKTLN